MNQTYSVDSLEGQGFVGFSMIQGWPAGFMLFAGDPKVGKSWYLLGMLLDEARLGNTVLYLALEDTERRIASRLDLIGDGYPPDLHISHDSINLKEWMFEHPETTMIVIDTLEQYEHGKMQSYTQSVEYLNTIHKVAEDHPDLLIVGIHHSRKTQSRDPFHGILGGTGITGSVDTLAILRKDQATGAFFVIFQGRDIESDTLWYEFEDGKYTEQEDAKDNGSKQIPNGAEFASPGKGLFFALIVVVITVYFIWGVLTA